MAEPPQIAVVDMTMAYRSDIDKEEAIKFFKAHAEWLKEQWSMTPEGREYEKKFKEAIDALSK